MFKDTQNSYKFLCKVTQTRSISISQKKKKKTRSIRADRNSDNLQLNIKIFF